MVILEEDEYKKWEKFTTDEYDKLMNSFRYFRTRYNDLRRLAVPVNTGMEENDECSDDSDTEIIQMSQPKKQSKVAVRSCRQKEKTCRYDLHDTCKS